MISGPNPDPAQPPEWRNPVSRSVVLLLLVYLAGAVLSRGTATWGIDYWNGLSWVWRLVVAGGTAMVCHPGIARQVSAWLVALIRGRPARIAIASVAVAGIILLRSRSLSYGDGYTIATLASQTEFPRIFGNLYTQPLDLAVHWLFHRFLVGPPGGSVSLTYAIVGVVSALVGVGAITRMARSLSGREGTRRLIVAGALGSGAVYLWFGYVESYTLALTAGLWVLALLMDTRRPGARIPAAWAVWILAMGFHALSVIWLPVLVWRSWRPVRRLRADAGTYRRVALWMVPSMFALTGLLSLLAPRWGIGILVPIAATPTNPYTAFSLAHLLDMANLAMFLAPVAVAGLPTGTKYGESTMPRVVLSLGGGTALVFAFWIDPTLGMFRDWDLLAACGVPLSIWGALRLADGLPRSVRPWAWVPMAMWALAHVGTWAVINLSESAVIDRVDALVKADIHYSAEYDQARRRAPWAQILTNRHNRHTDAAAHLLVRVAAAPGDAISWSNLGVMYQRRSVMDSAAICYLRAAEGNPGNPMHLLAYGQVEYAQGQWGIARSALEQVVRQAPDLYEGRMMLGAVYLSLGMWNQATDQMRAAKRIRPNRTAPDSLLSVIAHQRDKATPRVKPDGQLP